MPLKDFLLPPHITRDRDTVIEPGEVLTRVMVPAPEPNTRAAYHKQTERDSYDWPICDVAVVLQMSGQTVDAASIVAGWVAPTPRRAVESERVLIGKQLTEDLARKAAAAAVAGATPLSKNGYKVPILEAVVRRTIMARRIHVMPDAAESPVPGAPIVCRHVGPKAPASPTATPFVGITAITPPLSSGASTPRTPLARTIASCIRTNASRVASASASRLNN